MKYDVLVVGGGPAGIVTALTARKAYGPELTIGLMRREAPTLVPCGIPYMFGTLDAAAKNVMADKPLEAAGVEILNDEATTLDLESKTVGTRSGKTISFEKLVLATGSEPVLPDIEGVDLPGVFPIRKSYSYLDAVRQRLAAVGDVVVIGGGFIGVEFADELAKLPGRRVTVVEILDHCLGQSFDPEFSELAEKALAARGVRVLTGRKVSRMVGSAAVQAVELEDGQRLPAEAVILSVGARPSTALARQAGLRLTPRGAVAVDAAMRTSHPDVFAAGDAAAKTDFFSGGESPVMLASVAGIEARAAGTNLYEVRSLLAGGTPGAFATMVGELALASVGLTETGARRRGIAVEIGRADAVDRHPGTLPGARPVKVKLVFAAMTGRLLGGQVAGGASAGEMANVIALAVGHRMEAADLYLMPLGTHPLLTPAPTTYPVVTAAWDFLSRRRS